MADPISYDFMQHFIYGRGPSQLTAQHGLQLNGDVDPHYPVLDPITRTIMDGGVGITNHMQAAKIQLPDGRVVRPYELWYLEVAPGGLHNSRGDRVRNSLFDPFPGAIPTGVTPLPAGPVSTATIRAELPDGTKIEGPPDEVRRLMNEYAQQQQQQQQQ